MINIEDENVKALMQEIHNAMLIKAKRGKNTKAEFVTENRIFSLMCRDNAISPSRCAEKLNSAYDYDFTGDDVIRILRDRRLGNPTERQEIFRWADELAEYFAKSLKNDASAHEKFESMRRSSPFKSGKKHNSQERIAALSIFEKYPELDIFGDSENLCLLGNTLAKYFFYDMCDALTNVFNYEPCKSNEQAEAKAPKLSHEDALKKIEQLQSSLERTHIMLQDLQDEFTEQLEESKVKYLTEFFSSLNSEKYGCILDELLVIRKSVEKLRKSGFELPIELNGLLIMVKKLVQFIMDSHIEPIMKINAVKEVTAAEVEFCNYEGSPFSSADEVKKIRVISPGWIYKDKAIQISRPKVREESV